MPTNSLIKFSGVNFHYPCGRQALSNVSCAISRGAGVALIGANGAGKTSFLSLLSGLYLPKAGKVQIGSLELNDKNLKKIRQMVGFVFQNPDNQLFMLTVLDDVAFGPLNQGLNEKAAKEAAEQALAAVGILKLADRPPYQLSSGEKRLAAIAAVLSMQPEILALDEPSAGLDPYSRRKLINTLNSIQKTMLIATHDLDMVLDTCQEAIVLSNGEIAAQGTPEEIFADNGLLQRVRLEPPLSRQARN